MHSRQQENYYHLLFTPRLLRDVDEGLRFATGYPMVGSLSSTVYVLAFTNRSVFFHTVIFGMLGYDEN